MIIGYAKHQGVEFLKQVKHAHKHTKLHADLHPEEHSLIARLELEDKHPAGGAGGHGFELDVVREDDQVVLEVGMELISWSQRTPNKPQLCQCRGLSTGGASAGHQLAARTTSPSCNG